ncbi:MAG: hypothetical protein ACREU2_18305 [Steroidobacteraceae bacterium]
MAQAFPQTSRRIATAPSLLLLAGFLSVVPLQAAYAYIDPNSAGALYQFLFPLLIAAASALAALRRHIARLCSRLVGAVMTVVRGERPRPQSEREP